MAHGYEQVFSVGHTSPVVECRSSSTCPVAAVWACHDQSARSSTGYGDEETTPIRDVPPSRVCSGCSRRPALAIGTCHDLVGCHCHKETVAVYDRPPKRLLRGRPSGPCIRIYTTYDPWRLLRDSDPCGIAVGDASVRAGRWNGRCLSPSHPIVVAVVNG